MKEINYPISETVKQRTITYRRKSVDWDKFKKRKNIINESGWEASYKNIYTQYGFHHLTDNVNHPAVSRTTDVRPSLVRSRLNRLTLYGHNNLQILTAPTGNNCISGEWGTTAESAILACYLNQIRQKKETKIKIKYALQKCNGSSWPFPENHLKALWCN